MVDETKAPAGPAAPRRAADRRTQLRYKFSADAEISEEKSGTRMEARIDDISERGCHAETNSPFSLGTETKIRISKGGDSFSAQARVVSSSVNGLGLYRTGPVSDPGSLAWIVARAGLAHPESPKDTASSRARCGASLSSEPSRLAI
jgi:PilZ domain